MLQIRKFEFNPFQENTYVLHDETNQCVVVDPGCYSAEEQDELTSYIDDNQLTVAGIWNTHCHVDHVLGNWFIKKRYGVKLTIHPKEEMVLRAAKVYAPSYGIFDYQEADPDDFFPDSGTVKFGNQSFSLLFVPGHAPGHVAFYHELSGQVIAGDVLFYNSIGRTDLPGGDFQTLISSIHTRLFSLPDNVVVYPGHGPETTIGFEKKTNPFCRVQN